MKRFAALLTALFLLQGALELHGGASHVEEAAGETLFAQEAAHPESPLHLESSEPVRAHGCATCALAAHSKSLSPATCLTRLDARSAPLDPCTESVDPESALRLPASPRGPPAA